MGVKLTKRVVESIGQGDRDVIVWDTELRGFGCKVTPKGRRSYLLYYRTADGQQRKPGLGVHGVITCEQAREIARAMLADVAKGGDPMAAERAKRSAPTVAELADRFLTEHAATKKRSSSIRMDKINLKVHVLPVLGRLKAQDVTRGDIAQLHHRMRSTPGAANRVLALLSKMFNLAERWGIRPDHTNPCRHIERYAERKIERFLSGEELARREPLWLKPSGRGGNAERDRVGSPFSGLYGRSCGRDPRGCVGKTSTSPAGCLRLPTKQDRP